MEKKIKITFNHEAENFMDAVLVNGVPLNSGLATVETDDKFTQTKQRFLKFGMASRLQANMVRVMERLKKDKDKPTISIIADELMKSKSEGIEYAQDVFFFSKFLADDQSYRMATLRPLIAYVLIHKENTRFSKYLEQERNELKEQKYMEINDEDTINTLVLMSMGILHFYISHPEIKAKEEEIVLQEIIKMINEEDEKH